MHFFGLLGSLMFFIGMISVIIHSLFRLIISIVDHESIIDPQVLKGGEESCI